MATKNHTLNDLAGRSRSLLMADLISLVGALVISGVIRIVSEGHGVHVYEIRQKSQKFLQKYSQLENWKLPIRCACARSMEASAVVPHSWRRQCW